MEKIRVLIVDDAVMVRSRLSKILEADPDIEVAGVAATGAIAIAKLPQLRPHLVILDVEMPDLDGLQTLAKIRQIDAKLPVIMFSSLTTIGAAATLDALTLGASDYVTKPSQMGNVAAITEYLQTALISKIKALCQTAAQKRSPLLRSLSSFSSPIQRLQATQLAKIAVDIVAIGVSTGGPNALSTLLSQVPAHFPVPILIVQHMPPMFTQLLATRLTSQCQLPVREARTGETVRPGTIWLAPGDYHLSVVQVGDTVQLQLNQESPHNFCRPSVDVLFNSVAQVYGDRSLGVILTGMGQDGLQGCRQIRERNGQVLSQDEASSVVWGMPGAVVKAGLANAVLPLEQIMPEILRSCLLV
jgi:two-component system, chemotaxis family, protein-glutamate methylesterase/glutaminase